MRGKVLDCGAWPEGTEQDSSGATASWISPQNPNQNPHCLTRETLWEDKQAVHWKGGERGLKSSLLKCSAKISVKK